MKDPSSEIMTAFKTALNGNLTYNGVNWPVQDHVPTKVEYDTVFLSELTLMDDGAKDIKIFDCHLTIEIYGGIHIVVSRYDAVNSISNQITQLIYKQSLSMTNFTMTVRPWIEDIDMRTIPLATSLVPMKTVRFNFGCQEN